MGVQVKGDPDFRVSQALRSDLWMNAGTQKVCRVCVPQIVKSNAGETLGGAQADPFMRDGSRLQGTAIRLGHHKSVTAPMRVRLGLDAGSA